ncbi:MAG: hypothetical protein ACPGED_09810 [Flavobacteriales bacterium]
MGFNGFRNHYRMNMPFFEKLGKDAKYALKDFSKRIKNGGKLKTIVTYPEFPSKRTTIFKIADKLGYRLSNKPIDQAEVVLFFHDETNKQGSDPYLKSQKTVYNLHCTDISKSKVDAIHLEVFGYNTFVDPTQHQGLAVEKSDENAQHDGVTIQCPIAKAKEDKIYQLVINNEVNSDEVMDLRVPVVFGKLPLVYRKYKTMDLRFTNEVFKSQLTKLKDEFSVDEIQKIKLFAERMNVDFAEFDVLRHQNDGKIFIIDVNTTPYGPPAGLPKEDDQKALDLLSSAFELGIPV